MRNLAELYELLEELQMVHGITTIEEAYEVLIAGGVK